VWELKRRVRKVVGHFGWIVIGIFSKWGREKKEPPN